MRILFPRKAKIYKLCCHRRPHGSQGPQNSDHPIAGPNERRFGAGRLSQWTLHAVISYEGCHRAKRQRLLRHIVRDAIAPLYLNQLTAKVVYTLQGGMNTAPRKCVLLNLVDSFARLATLVDKPCISLSR